MARDGRTKKAGAARGTTGRPRSRGKAVPAAPLARQDDERFAALLARTRAALLQKERLRILGTLAGSVAHDLGTTLRGAALHVEALRRDPAVAGEHAASLDSLAMAIESASDVVGHLHTFAKGGTLAIGTVDLTALCREACRAVSMLTRHRSDLKIDCAVDRMPPVPGSVGEVTHLVMNLLLNAVDACEKGGVIRVSAAVRGARVVLSVTDEGAGIALEHRAKVFEPFFTTKGDAGTGLGLWLARATMLRLGGEIDLDGEPGRGTTVTLTFPVAASWSSRGPAGTDAGRPGAKGRRRPPRS